MSTRIPMLVPITIKEDSNNLETDKIIGSALLDLINFPLKDLEINLIAVLKQDVTGTGTLILEDEFDSFAELARVTFTNAAYGTYKSLLFEDVIKPIIDSNGISCIRAKIFTSAGGNTFIKHASLRVL